MKDLRKAAEMALDALEWNYGTDLCDIENCMAWLDKMNATIQTLRQALAQPVDAVNISQERVDETAKREHEPYGYVWTSLRDGMEVRFSRMPPNKFYNPQDIKPVYTAPPKREWVGLTDEEIDGIYKTHHDQYGKCQTGGFDYERSIEAKLKEKNSG